MIVVDASVIVALCLEELDADVGIDFDSLTTQQIIVPSHCPTEVGNALVMNMRRGRLRPGDLAYAVRNLKALRIEPQAPPSINEIEAIVRSAIQSGLTFYDQLYVELAKSRALILFTLDQQMANVARNLDLTVLPD